MEENMKKEFNTIYQKTNERCRDLASLFCKARTFNYHTCFKNDTYEKLKNGRFIQNEYPVSAIHVHNYGMILIDENEIFVHTKLNVNDLVNFMPSRFASFDYEIYSCHERNYIFFKSNEVHTNKLKEKVNEIYDNDVMFEFSFPFQIDKNEMFDFFKLLKRNRFKYE